jgi:hypothetical protein
MNIRKSAPALALAGMVAMALSAAPFAAARADDDTDLSLNYVPGSSMKIEQVTGDCDWAIYDQTSPPVCQRTVSQTTTRSDVLGNGLGASFEHEGNLIFLFGDIIGASRQYVPQYASLALETKFNDFLFDAADPIAWSATRRAEDGLNLSFFPSHTANTPTLLVQPQYTVVHHFPEGDSTLLPMGGDDIPDSGISIRPGPMRKPTPFPWFSTTRQTCRSRRARPASMIPARSATSPWSMRRSSAFG